MAATKLSDYLEANKKKKLRAARAKLADAVRPNIGHEVRYRRQLQDFIEKMHRSVMYWLTAAYRANPPVVAIDELPAAVLKRALGKMSSRWTREFDKLSKAASAGFVQRAAALSRAQLVNKFERAGLTVNPDVTEGVEDVIRASIQENVALIKSIPEQYLREVEGLVYRSVEHGRDLGWLTDELEKRYTLTRDRAALIARDQNNKVTSVITRARQLDLGVTEGIWLHSAAGKHPRPTHVKMSGKKFDIKKGMWDSAEGRYVMPGELINCRCVWKPVIEGFS